MRVAVIGGGWYGCHIALTLSSIAEVTLYEKNSDLMTEASGNNQFRLHQGFHYARHHRTRVQSRNGFQRFMERYPTLSAPVRTNLYSVPSDKSLLDFDTYKQIMRVSGLEFKEVETPFLKGVEGSIEVEERVLLTQKARDYFRRRIPDLRLDTPFEEVNETHDHVVDATWGKYERRLDNVYFEPTVLFNYWCPNTPAVTMVDGPLCSLYPTEKWGVYTLSSVVYTPLAACQTIQEARETLRNVSVETLRTRHEKSIDQFKGYYPDFDGRFIDYQFSIKTKPVDLYDSRETNVTNENGVFRVMSGKIDTIFQAADQIMGMIEG